MRFYEKEYPDVDEYVVVKVKTIAEMGAYVSLMVIIFFFLNFILKRNMIIKKAWYYFQNYQKREFVL